MKIILTKDKVQRMNLMIFFIHVVIIQKARQGVNMADIQIIMKKY